MKLLNEYVKILQMFANTSELRNFRISGTSFLVSFSSLRSSKVVACNPSTEEAEASESQIPDQPVLTPG